MRRGELAPIKHNGATLWTEDPNKSKDEPIGFLRPGSLVLYLGEELDYYVKVLSHTGKIGWIHKSNVEGAKMPSLFYVVAKKIFREGKGYLLAIFGSALFWNACFVLACR